MVAKKDEEDVNYYVCEKCGVSYEEKKWAERCEAWCSEHKGSCNLDIIQHAVSNQDKDCC